MLCTGARGSRSKKESDSRRFWLKWSAFSTRPAASIRGWVSTFYKPSAGLRFIRANDQAPSSSYLRSKAGTPRYRTFRGEVGDDAAFGRRWREVLAGPGRRSRHCERIWPAPVKVRQSKLTIVYSIGIALSEALLHAQDEQMVSGFQALLHRRRSEPRSRPSSRYTQGWFQ